MRESERAGVGAEARPVPCPRCRVLAEIPCMKDGGGRAKRSHADRYALWEATLSQDVQTALDAVEQAQELTNKIIDERMPWKRKSAPADTAGTSATDSPLPTV